MSKQLISLRTKRRMLLGIAGLVMCASLIVPSDAFAHNISVAKARETVRNYARGVRDNSNGAYSHYSTNCVAAFPNHNHIARCLVDYQNDADWKKGVYTCRETVEVKMLPHSKSGQENYELYGYHTSTNTCGRYRLDKAVMH